MGLQCGVGTSQHRNASEAGRLAAEAALREAGAETCDFVIMFGTVGYDQKRLVEAVRKATNYAPLCGCSAEGIIAQQVADEGNHCIAVMAFTSTTMKFTTCTSHGLKDDSLGAGVAAANQLGKLPDDAVALFLFADGLSFNFDQFRTGFEAASGFEGFLPMLGGTAADNWKMTQTYQYHNDEVFSDGVSCALLHGEGEIAFDVSHGCVPIGHERTVTRAEGNLIYEIDGKPVLEVLKEYLAADEIDDFNKAIVNLCLGFKAPDAMGESYDEFIIRFMPAKDEKGGSVTIPTEVAVGTKVWMTRRDSEKMFDGVIDLAARLNRKFDGHKPKLVLHFDCAGRGRTMFRDDEKRRLITRLQELVSDDIPWIGFYTYGEIGPVRECNYFHNYTAVVAGVY